MKPKIVRIHDSFLVEWVLDKVEYIEASKFIRITMFDTLFNMPMYGNHEDRLDITGNES